MDKYSIEIPENIKKLIEIAYENGEKAYIVGGCVRDSLILKCPEDWDITISSSPEKTKKIYKNYKTIDTGIKYGTVTVLTDEMSFEITTFRQEDDYIDFRHPEKINFSKNIEEDLKRRDFTINAMAYNHKEGLVDIFGGISDLEKNIIRCVGNPFERFKEDPLRILRGIRFKSTLSFEIEEKTKKEMFNNFHLLLNVSAERKKEEIEKMLRAGKENKKVINEFEEIIKLSLGIKKVDTAKEYIENTNDTEIKWAILLTDTENTEKICKDLKFSNSLKKLCLVLKENKDKNINTLKDTRELVKNYGELTKKILEFKNSLGQNMEKAFDFYEKIKKENLCCSLKTLAVKGRDLEKLNLFPKTQYKTVLNTLLDKVINEEIPNEKEALIKKIKTEF